MDRDKAWAEKTASETFLVVGRGQGKFIAQKHLINDSHCLSGSCHGSSLVEVYYIHCLELRMFQGNF